MPFCTDYEDFYCEFCDVCCECICECDATVPEVVLLEGPDSEG